MNNNTKELTHHGGLNTAELCILGIDPAQVLDFSTNINAYGPSPAVMTVLSTTNISNYPDKDSISLRTVLAEKENISIHQLLIGNGTSELIWLITFEFLKPGDDVLICSPTFSEYERCSRLMKANITYCEAKVENDFHHSVESIQNALNQFKPKLCFICNPNNPTGVIINPSSITSLVSQNPDTLFVIDEAYLAFVKGMESAYQSQQKNLLVLRSMTKEYALAGLRLGYALGHPQIIKKLTEIRPAWNVNALALAAGIASIEDKNRLKLSLEKLFYAKQVLLRELGKIGYSSIPSSTHYFLCKVGNAESFRRSLLINHYIQVRDCASFSLPDYVRICTRSPDENQHLLTAIKELKQ